MRVCELLKHFSLKYYWNLFSLFKVFAFFIYLFISLLKEVRIPQDEPMQSESQSSGKSVVTSLVKGNRY